MVEEVKTVIAQLVEKYKRIVEENRDSKYNEEMTTKDFILPLFRALCWNVEDSSEVTAEEKVSKKRVDYGFRINGIPKFFLEAKALKEDLDNRKFIEQAINYAWHKGCTWAVLSNFETVSIFNAELKTDSPWLTHLKTIHSYEFLKRFDELWHACMHKWHNTTCKEPRDPVLFVSELLLAVFSEELVSLGYSL